MVFGGGYVCVLVCDGVRVYACFPVVDHGHYERLWRLLDRTCPHWAFNCRGARRLAVATHSLGPPRVKSHPQMN